MNAVSLFAGIGGVDGTGRGTPLVVSLAVADEFSSSEDTAQTIRAARGQPGCVAVGFAENQRAELTETPYVRSLTTGGGKPGSGYGAVRHDTAVRRLTPLECERLQGFPDGWTDGQSDSARYRQLGNAVAVPVAEWIARRIAAADRAVTTC